MDRRLRVSLQIASGCLVAHIFGYLVPTTMFIYSFCCVFWKLLCYLCAAALGFYLSYKPHPYLVKTFKTKTNECIISKTKEKLKDLKFSPGKVKSTPLVSRNVDDVIDELISLLLRDYVNSWYSPLVPQPSLFCKQLKDPIRQMLFTLRDRCRKIDDVQLFTNDFVMHIRCAVINPSEQIVPYKIYKFLAHKESELDHLRSLCGFLLTTILPPEYVKHKQLLYLLREIFTTTVFYPVIDKICDPDFINLKLISYLKQKQMQAEKRSHTYEYAETYEDFIKLIQECTDLEELQRMRYYIATEIMQSSTMSNLKRSKGIDADKEFSPLNTSKGDLLQARNLPRYSNQLRFARAQCEKRLKVIGGPDYVSPRVSSQSQSKTNYMPGQKVLSMSVIMQSSFCRRFFSKFLQKEKVHSLLGFWEAVEEMKHSDKEQWHKLGNDIVQMYVHDPSSSVRLNRNTLKGIEQFMIANKGPEAFFSGQEEVHRILESNYYASFIVSDIYHKMLADVDKQGIDFMQEVPDNIEDIETSIEDGEEVKMPDASELSLYDHSSYARSQLKLLKEKLGNKNQALQALRNNPKAEKTQVVTMLETEIEKLIQEQNMLENHIEKTELWIVYLGVWQASIMEAMEKKENDKVIPYFVIRVHLASDAEFLPNKMAGWIVSRNLNSFHSLHQKLVPAASWLKKLDLPTKPIFKTFDRNYLEKMKHSLQIFLSAVTKDDGLNKNESLYHFLSPSPEYMKHPPSTIPKKPWKFSVLQFLKGVQNTLTPFDDAEEEELLFLDDNDKEEKRDPIAEPLYALIGEIFTLKGGFNWLRRSLINFVQVAYGQTINRQLQKTVSYILSEPMLLFYLQLFRETMWPPGPPPPNVPERTKEEKLNTKIMAKQMFVSNTPIVLRKLVGQQSAIKGTSKIFDSLQNKKSNKQLCYKLFEAFIYQYAPELKQITSLYNIDKKYPNTL
ncbi:hypothetical protein JTE90_006791 [Oedothorax gibbosus]|uniref:Sorting nexin-25 n=1 Tax=Oedothorax gibbosus TaxID=931172 RepID=A0AAV6VLS3_9ARAC|nr:hypothetical protein JTE90_006791 [Oedothorax gibbosus]